MQKPAERLLVCSTLVAIHTNRRIIGITIHAIVMTIRLRLVRMRRDSRVAGINTGKNLIVGRVDMAIAAARTLVRNQEISMVEDRA